MSEAVRVTYRLGGGLAKDPAGAAEKIALGQTVETWTVVDYAGDGAIEAHKARVVDAGPWPGAPGVGRAVIDFPTANVEASVAPLLTMILGKVSFAGPLRVEDVALPERFSATFPGPKFGVPGLRRLLGVPHRPLAMSIFKPCLGLDPKQLAEMFEAQARGGVDLVKDDEILPDYPTAPALERARRVREAADRAEAETGRRCLYAVNLTGRADALVERAVRLIDAGATALLFNVLAYGYPLLEALAAEPRVTVPIMAHPALAGALAGGADRGIAYGTLLGTFTRLAGADMVLFPSAYGKPALPIDETAAITHALRDAPSPHAAALPGPSAGVHPGMVPRIVDDY
ncbi:MAG: hypothetical protein KC466_21610, partial [Myxococcales bacterium]|nr:hypothetical protein [Myxococcales bacterium]